MPGNQGLSISPYDMRNAILRCLLFLLPILSSVSLSIERSLFRAGQSPFSQTDTPAIHTKPCTDEETAQKTCGMKDTLGHPDGPSVGRLVYPQMSSVEVFLNSCSTFSLRHGKASVSNAEEPWSRQKANGGCCSCSSVASLISEISN